MVLAVYIIMMLFIVTSLGLYIGFVRSEGKDERGQAILSKSSQFAFIFLLLGFVFQLIFFEFADPTVEQIRMVIAVWMALVFGSNGASILYFQRKM